MARFTLDFASELSASPEEAWAWVISVAGIRKELRPLVQIRVPRGITTVFDVDIELGKPLLRSWLLLFGLFPLDRIDHTLIEFREGRGFVEESPTLNMRLWRHERSVEAMPDGSKVTDSLTFEPRLPGPIVKWFISRLFQHRHRVLKRELGASAA